MCKYFTLMANPNTMMCAISVLYSNKRKELHLLNLDEYTKKEGKQRTAPSQIASQIASFPLSFYFLIMFLTEYGNTLISAISLSIRS